MDNNVEYYKMNYSGRYHIVTYATHVQGRFNELVNNSFKASVVVLGMGEKWNGFMDKPIAVNKYIQNLNDNDIVVVLDGFDTIIKHNPSIAIDKFVKMKVNKALVSKENYMMMGKLFQQRFFGVCKKNNNMVANAGMLMGYVKHLKLLYHGMIQYHNRNPDLNGDDMRILNRICKDNLYAIDSKEKIFCNVVGNIFAKADASEVKEAVFVSFPARSDQGIIEKFARFYEQSDVYLKVLWKEFLMAFLIIVIIIWFISSRVFAKKK